MTRNPFPAIAAIETVRIGAYPNLLWVEVEDETGARGLGETFFGADAVEAAIHTEFAPKLIGAGSAPEPARARLRPHVGSAAPGAETRAASAIDIALWDLWGRRLDLPIHALLGGASRERIRCYNTCAGPHYIRAADGQNTANFGLRSDGRSDGGGYEDLQAFLTDAGRLAESLLDEGVDAMKIWPFDAYAEASHGATITPAQLREGVEPFRKIRDAVGDRVQIMLELHALWTAPAARDIALAVAPFDVFWVEDPIPMDDFATLADLRRAIPQKITASETLTGRASFSALMGAGAVDVVMLDVAWCGGLTEAKAIASIAEARRLPIAPHDCTGPVVFAASCHLSVQAPNAMIQERVRALHAGWYADVMDGLPVFEAGTVRPAEAAGHGVRFKADILTRPDLSRRRSGA